jgi:hypothetical protein
MNVASLDLCRELYDLSGWNETDKWYGTWYGDEDWAVGVYDPNVPDCYPAYDLGDLLRRLPATTSITRALSDYTARTKTFDETVSVPRTHTALPARWMVRGDTPENAAAKLAVELFKQGILAKGAGEARA